MPIRQSFAASACALLLASVMPLPAQAASKLVGVCSGKVAFVGLAPSDPTSGSLSAAQPMITQLSSSRYPVTALQFQFLASELAGDQSNLGAVVNELEAKVTSLVSQGYMRIGLPPRSTVLAPFILGSAGSLGGVGLDTRHPGVVFTVTNPGTPVVDGSNADNVFRFLDVTTSGDRKIGLSPLLGAGGTVLVLSQLGDPVSQQVRDAYVAASASLGRTTVTLGLGYTDFSQQFSPSDLQNALQQIQNLAAGSVVVHIVNGNPDVQAAYSTQALAAGVFIVGAGVRHLGGNFFPSAALPVAMEFGQALVWNPSRSTELVGLPTKYDEWLVDGSAQDVALYLESYVWMATCGEDDGLLDGFIAFDAGGTSIQFQLERQYVDAGGGPILHGERRANPRWYTDKVSFSTKALFGIDLVSSEGFE